MTIRRTTLGLGALLIMAAVSHGARGRSPSPPQDTPAAQVTASESRPAPAVEADPMIPIVLGWLPEETEVVACVRSPEYGEDGGVSDASPMVGAAELAVCPLVLLGPAAMQVPLPPVKFVVSGTLSRRASPQSGEDTPGGVVVWVFETGGEAAALPAQVAKSADERPRLAGHELAAFDIEPETAHALAVPRHYFVFPREDVMLWSSDLVSLEQVLGRMARPTPGERPSWLERWPELDVQGRSWCARRRHAGADGQNLGEEGFCFAIDAVARDRVRVWHSSTSEGAESRVRRFWAPLERGSIQGSPPQVDGMREGVIRVSLQIGEASQGSVTLRLWALSRSGPVRR